MKKKLKVLYDFCSGLFESMISILSVIFFSSFKTNKYFKSEKKDGKMAMSAIFYVTDPHCSLYWKAKMFLIITCLW